MIIRLFSDIESLKDKQKLKLIPELRNIQKPLYYRAIGYDTVSDAFTLLGNLIYDVAMSHDEKEAAWDNFYIEIKRDKKGKLEVCYVMDSTRWYYDPLGEEITGELGGGVCVPYEEFKNTLNKIKNIMASLE